MNVERPGEEEAFEYFQIGCLTYVSIIVINFANVVGVPSWVIGIAVGLWSFILWPRVLQIRTEAAIRHLGVVRLELERQLSEWTEARTRTIRQLNNIADKIYEDRRNCNIAKTDVTCLDSIAQFTTLLSSVGVFKLPINENTIRMILSASETVTDYTDDFIGDFRSSRGAEEANRVIQEDNEHTFSTLCQQQRRYYLSLVRYMELGRSIDNVVVRYRTNGSCTEVFIAVGSIFRTRIANFNNNNNRVKSVITKCISYGKLSSGLFSESRELVGLPGEGKTPKQTKPPGETEPPGTTEQLAIRVLVMVADIAAIHERFSEILVGSPDAAAEEIRRITRDLEEQIPTMDDITLESLLRASTANDLEFRPFE